MEKYINSSLAHNIPTLGEYGLVDYNPFTTRPIANIIAFQSRFIPSEAEDETTDERYFFNICVHEVIHSMGFSNAFYPYYVDKATGNPYEKAAVEFKRGNYNKTFIALCTPKCKEVVQRRFGLFLIYGDI